ncbi:MAG: hypothetical protein GY842_26210, partial [bacterium]|nr:hypothetical protein [bacterium]
GLEIDSATTLRFAPGAVLYATGPVGMNGDPQSPIVLEPQGKTWGGVVVSAAAEVSEWESVVVKGTSPIQRGGWMLTGGVTFYRCDAHLARVTFLDNTSEDALNIIHGVVELEDCVFENCAADAFDGDYVTGAVKRCRFADVGGDAVDVSGSRLRILDLRAERVVDKVISSGERSVVTASRVTIDQAGIAIASKDSSSVELADSMIRHARIGLAAYVKKPVHGPASVVARNVQFADTMQTVLAQTGSSVQLNGIAQDATELDVATLYARRTAEN